MIFSTKRFLPRIFSGLCLSAVAGLSAQAQQQTDNKVLSIERNTLDNTAKSIRFAPASNIPSGSANDLFTQYLGLDGKENVMISKHNTTTKTGLTTMRYTQYYKGIKVEYGGATLLVKNGAVSLLTSNYYTFNNHPSTTAAIAERSAFELAKKFVGAQLYKWEIPAEEEFIKQLYKKPDTSFMPHGVLVWIDDMSTSEGDRKIRLAYRFDIYAEKPLSRQHVFIDAATGKVLFSNALIKHTSASGVSKYSGNVAFETAKPGTTYLLYDSTRGGGIYTLNMNNSTTYSSAVNFASPTNTWPTATSHNIALDAQWGTEKVYDYWLSEHGRDSWDDMGSILQSYVHYGTNYNNAFWNGAFMTYGDGSGSGSGGFDPLTSLDVTAHEIGHGVCSATSDLIYTKESGAMNEGFSDCWAATIEHYADPLETDAQPKRTWYIGEEIGAGNPLRRMDLPKLKNDPDTYGGTYWYNVVGCTPTSSNDQCGVHNNSGVLNKFYYLLTEGGSGTNDKGSVYSVTGLGWTKSPIILYQTELVLSNTATYADCRAASIAVTEALYGTCSPEVKSVIDAWYAVGVGAIYVPCSFIEFELVSLDTSEFSSSVSCPSSTIYKIGLKPSGPAFVGGSPTANLTIAGGTAISGKDYTLSATSLTFPLGSTATQYADLTVFDNGAVKDSKNIILDFTLSPLGSNVIVNPDFDTMTINLKNNDSIPDLITPIETAFSSTRTWDVHKGEEVYFYNATNNNLIAGIKDMSSDLGCLQTTITGSGIGFVPAIFSPAKRSLKEISFTPNNPGKTTTYQVTIYFTNAELAGVMPSTLKLLKTDELTDSTITILNSVTVIPTVITGTAYVGFSATFTGMTPTTRFMLIDGNLSPASTKTQIVDNLKPVLAPNPNDGNFSIKGRMKNLYTGQASIVVTNMLGQIIHSSETVVSNGFMNSPISLTQAIAKGVYFVNVTAGDERIIFHLVLDK
ncbi:MAG: M4 family metallopeptidase [Bacteroidota bacterium]